ncbi:MAG: hypothetical protein LUB59_04870 [Candidatus Gastranaerophilales bacterium]|nr:hypothetical protein [Candidatus Gastranaerophilales bacterium]
MARNRTKKKNLFQQMKETLDGKLAIGQSKKADKIIYQRDENGSVVKDKNGEKIILKEDETKDKIYSWNTYRTYLRHDKYFVNWCREEKGCKNLSQCRSYADEYLQKLIDENKSASTIKMTVSAIGKLYGESSDDFIKTPERHRKDIKRSRGVAVRDKHFSEKNNAELISFCRCTGLRRAELEHLKGSDLVEEDGKFYLHVHTATKGGRERFSPITGTEEEVMAVVNRMNAAGDNLVWSKVSGHADIHSYRSDYCMRVYHENARDIKDIKNWHEIYYCKSDLKGVAYDKNAMLIASRALGHNRINVIASNYLRSS